MDSRTDRRESQSPNVAGADRLPAPSPLRAAGGVLPIAFLVAATVFCVFSPCLQNGFVWDDTPSFETNEGFRGLGPSQLAWMFTTFHMGHYQPLSWVSLGLDYTLWGMRPFGYHLTNLLLHAVNASLVFLLAAELIAVALGRSSVGAQEIGGIEPRAHDASPGGLLIRGQEPNHALAALAVLIGGAAAALLFALHPMRVESVSWITERRDVLSAFFLLLTVLVYVRTDFTDRQRRFRSLTLAWILFLLSLLSRAGGMVLPFVLLVLDFYPLRRLGRSGGVWLEKVPFLIVAAVFAAVAGKAVTSVEATTFWQDHGLVARFSQACFGLVFYLYKSLVPYGLIPFYELRLPVEPLSLKYLGSIVLVAGGAIVVLGCVRRLPAVTAAALCYAMILAPVLGFLQSGPQEVADRYSYQANISWAVLIGGLLAMGWRTALYESRRRFITIASTGVTLMILGGLAVSTWHQCAFWRSDFSLWVHTVNHAPRSPLVRRNLARAMLARGMVDEALIQYRAARQIKPEEPNLKLAQLLAETGRFDEAVADLQAILSVHPDLAKAHALMGFVLARRGDGEQAVAHYREAIRLDSDLLDARVELAMVLYDLGRYSEAAQAYELLFMFDQARGPSPWLAEALLRWGLSLRQLGRNDEANVHLNEAVEVDSSMAGRLSELGIAWAPPGDAPGPSEPAPQSDAIDLATQADKLAAVGKRVEAIRLYRQAIELQPTNFLMHFNLAETLYANQQFEEALVHYRRTAELEPEFPWTFNSLGLTYNDLDRTAEAEEAYREAIRLAPDLLEAHYNLGTLLARIGRHDEAIAEMERALQVVDASGRADLRIRIQDRIERIREEAAGGGKRD